MDIIPIYVTVVNENEKNNGKFYQYNFIFQHKKYRNLSPADEPRRQIASAVLFCRCSFSKSIAKTGDVCYNYNVEDCVLHKKVFEDLERK